MSCSFLPQAWGEQGDFIPLQQASGNLLSHSRKERQMYCRMPKTVHPDLPAQAYSIPARFICSGMSLPPNTPKLMTFLESQGGRNVSPSPKKLPSSMLASCSSLLLPYKSERFKCFTLNMTLKCDVPKLKAWCSPLSQPLPLPTKDTTAGGTIFGARMKSEPN